MARSAWLRPVPGATVEAFSYSRADRFAAGQRRGIVLAAAPGQPVLAACSGRVVFSGSVGRAGPTTSVQCGALRATYQGITNSGIEEGTTVRAGDVIARAGPAGAIHLGARTAPGHYVDPATLFARPAPPLGPAPTSRRPRRPDPPPLAVLGRQPTRTPTTTAPTPPALWLALVLAAAALGPITVRRRSRRQPFGSSSAAVPASASSAAARPSQP
ncbi:MAG: peptidoglycan DD-metalloendopeptidase family protein [Solirubrobacteraceae bacterium]